MVNTEALPPNYSNTRWLMIGLALVLTGLVLWNIRNILLYGLAAIILVILISMPVRFLSRFGIRRFPAILITFAGFGLLAYLLTLMVLPTLVDQFVLLGDAIADGVNEAIEYYNSGQLVEDYPILQDLGILNPEEETINVETIRRVGEQVLDALSQLSGSVLPFLGGIANTLLSVLIVFFLTIFFLSNPDQYKNGFVKLFPKWYRHRVYYIMERLNTLLRRWIVAQLIGMVVSGIGTYIGLRLIGIEQAAALAVLTAIFSLVPNFGELIAVGVSLAVAAVQAPDRLLWVIIVIYGISFLQNQVIGPLVTSESVNIPPVLILLGQIIVAGFFGVIGIILAVPILVIVMVVVQEVYIKDILGDDSPGDLTAIERVIKKHGYKLSRRPSEDMTDGLQPDGV
ncbi:MAG: AI-2E family transporter [Phototrophicales bacterium]|nr:MAG: AI-2E family transporter [Chloroflexota bacterium]